MYHDDRHPSCLLLPITRGNVLGRATTLNVGVRRYFVVSATFGAIVAITVFLRQRGSSQSKPVGAPHHSTGVES